MPVFNGFPPQCLPFLKQLRANNERAWFNEHKAGYEAYVREPALAFIEAMADELKTISSHFRAIAKKSGGSLMRVYRDTRFSKDKTPYKTNIGIQFRHERGRDVHAPGFYLHIEPGDCFIGAGIWHPDSKSLAKIREFMVDNPNAWQQALAHKPFKRNFELVGDRLQRPPRGYAADHPLIDELKRKDFIALRPLADKSINDKQLIKRVSEGFKQTDLLMHYLCDALELDY